MAVRLTKSLAAAILALLIGQGWLDGSKLVSAQTQAAGADKGEQILRDKSLFPEDVVGPFLRFIDSLGLDISRAPVPQDRAPRLSDIQAKYGKSDRTQKYGDNRELLSQRGCPLDEMIHWYGQYGFCVNPAEAAAAKVSGLVFIKRATPGKSR